MGIELRITVFLRVRVRILFRFLSFPVNWLQWELNSGPLFVLRVVTRVEILYLSWAGIELRTTVFLRVKVRVFFRFDSFFVNCLGWELNSGLTVFCRATVRIRVRVRIRVWVRIRAIMSADWCDKVSTPAPYTNQTNPFLLIMTFLINYSEFLIPQQFFSFV